MKKNISYLLIGIFICAFAYSCNQEENLVSQDVTEQQAFDELCAELVKLNIETFGEDYAEPNFETEIGTRARKKWWQWLTVAFTDAGVTLISGGNLGWGVSASNLVWSMVKTEAGAEGVSPRQTVYPETTRMRGLILTETVQGHTHNVVSSAIYNRFGESFYTNAFPDDTKIMYLMDQLSIETGNSSWRMMNTRTILNGIQPFIDIYTQSSSVDEIIMLLQRQYPTIHNELNVFGEVMRGFQNLDVDRDTGQYAEQALRIVRLSSINAMQKLKLYDAVGIANASVRMWNQPLFNR